MSSSAIVERAAAIAAKHAAEAGPLLPILHAVQKEFGYIPAQTVAPIARALHLSRAEVHGVISFYDAFRTTAAGDRILTICRAESCRAMGGAALEQHARKTLGIDYHETTADGSVTLEPVYCLGNCACSPSVMLDGELHSRVTPAHLDRLLNQ